MDNDKKPLTLEVTPKNRRMRSLGMRRTASAMRSIPEPEQRNYTDKDKGSPALEETPKNRRIRSLGIRRAASAICSTSTSQSQFKQPPGMTASSMPRMISSQSDIKAPSLSLVRTPVGSRTAPAKSQLFGTSSERRSYRLTLNNNLGQRFSKKRLFQGSHDNELEPIEINAATMEGGSIEADSSTISGLVEDNVAVVKPPLCPMETSTTQHICESRSELIKRIHLAEQELETLQEHERKVQELKNCIDMWKMAFCLALDDLHSEVPEPKMPKMELIKYLGISSEMMKYVED